MLLFTICHHFKTLLIIILLHLLRTANVHLVMQGSSKLLCTQIKVILSKYTVNRVAVDI